MGRAERQRPTCAGHCRSASCSCSQHASSSQTSIALQLFVYLLCQGTLRPLVAKMFSWGPSRAMAESALTDVGLPLAQMPAHSQLLCTIASFRSQPSCLPLTTVGPMLPKGWGPQADKKDS